MTAGRDARGRKVFAFAAELAVLGNAEQPVFEVAIRKLKNFKNIES